MTHTAAAVRGEYGANVNPFLAKLQAGPRLKGGEKNKFKGPWNRMVRAVETSNTNEQNYA